MPKTFFSYSFGCRVNHAEKEALDRQLIARGYEFTDTNPNICIINTCAVTHKAEREAKQYIYNIRRTFPLTKIIVTGCASTNWLKQNIRIAEVDLLIDNASKEFIAEILDKEVNNITPSLTTNKIKFIQNDKFLKSKRLILKIQDGCHRFCSYCIVPYLRGLPLSVPSEKLVQTIKDYEHSIQEVVLTAINTEAYGRDTQESLTELLQNILKQTSISRISFGSIHPWSINDELLTFYENNLIHKRIVPFFHIPLQSGSNKMLNLMKRGYAREEFIEKLRKLASYDPFTFIATDVIVGFLEETDTDFEDTYTFLKESPISRFHVFRYSVREHTAGFYLGKRLKEPDAQTKHKRSKALIDLSLQKFTEFQKKHIGYTFQAFFLEKREGEYQYVLLDNNMEAVIYSKSDLCGEIHNVKIDTYKNKKIFGTIVE
ncbi:MAG: MiaB/RimO family radical SAM methylthiotransferase [Candidatus Roizmanbacteria bacterium]